MPTAPKQSLGARAWERGCLSQEAIKPRGTVRIHGAGRREQPCSRVIHAPWNCEFPEGFRNAARILRILKNGKAFGSQRQTSFQRTHLVESCESFVPERGLCSRNREAACSGFAMRSGSSLGVIGSLWYADRGVLADSTNAIARRWFVKSPCRFVARQAHSISEEPSQRLP